MSFEDMFGLVAAGIVIPRCNVCHISIRWL